MHDTQLSSLIRMDTPQDVLEEALLVIKMFSSTSDTHAIRSAFNQTVALYEGEWPDMRGCNTDYHNLKHATDCFLAMVRLLHGAAASGVCFSPTDIHCASVAALLHDAGYLQHSEDTLGTGAKFAAIHVRRGMEFVQRHYAAWGISHKDVHACITMIHCTDLAIDLSEIPFPDSSTERLGKMLAAADLLSQMSDRSYLEKLDALYGEMNEARVSDCADELDFLKSSREFYFKIMDRLEHQLASVNRLMIHHFKARWEIDRDLYQVAMDNQQNYLQLALSSEKPRNCLRRGRGPASIDR